MSAFQSHSLSIQHAGHEQTSHVARYTVTDSNESAIYYWWSEDYSQSWTYNVEIGSEIELEIDDPTNQNSAMNITIGNLTRLDETDLNMENNLGIGYWLVPEVLGFVSSKDWSAIDSSLTMQNFTTYSFNDSANYTFGAATFEAVNMTFADAFQSTTLSYNKETGILYYANLKIFNFFLEFEINGYIPYEDNSVNETSFNDLGYSYLSLIIGTITLGLFIGVNRVKTLKH